jgi:hypothetical protein
LLDVSFRHLNQWWLAGMPIKDTSDWFTFVIAATGGADITNQFILFGLTAGLGAVVLFLVLLTRAFSGLGKSMAAFRSSSHHSGNAEFLLWGLGVALAVHIANWFGISYFDQFYVLWFMQLAAISSISATFPEAVLQERQSAQSATSLDVLEAEAKLKSA